MIAKLTIVLSGLESEKQIYNISSIMQGVLMERIDSDYADYLHHNQVHPYSQNIRKKENLIYWEINTLNREAKEKIIDPWMDDSEDKIFLKQRNCYLQIKERHYSEQKYNDLLKQYLFQETDRILKIRLNTPVSFKQKGQYCIFPSVRLIFQSLMHKYDACAPDSSSFDDEILEHYEKYAHIVRYKLRSSSFPLEGVRIPAFQGEITIKISGPQQMANLANMLLQYGTYSGIGIKTAMGMGAIELL